MYQTSIAKTNVISIDQDRFVWRRIGTAPGTPLVLFNYMMGCMDDWGPALIDRLAEHFSVYLFDSRGVGRSEGTTPASIPQMAEDAWKFLQAMGISRMYLLGFSMGGMVAQAFAAAHPEAVEKLVLAGTGASGAAFQDEHTVPLKENALRAILRHRDPRYYLMFEQTPKGQAAANAFLSRLQTRRHDRDLKIRLTSRTLKAQIKGILAWFSVRIQDPAALSCPTLVLGGERDGMVAASCARELARLIPGARLKIYPDCGHGFLFQYPEEAAADVTAFLKEQKEQG